MNCCVGKKEQNEQEMRSFLMHRSSKLSADDFAEHILRNYGIEQRKAYGDTTIEQAYNVLRKNLNGYKDITENHETARSVKYF